MELDDYPVRRTLAWLSSLKKNQDMLELLVMANAYGQSELLAQVSYDDTVTVLRALLKTTTDKV